MDNHTMIHNFASIDDFYTCSKNNLNVSINYNVNTGIVNLYSYNTIIAKRYLLNNTYLVSTYRYSSTTGKHLSILRSALHGYNVIYVNDVNISNKDNIITKIITIFISNILKKRYWKIIADISVDISAVIIVLL